MDFQLYQFRFLTGSISLFGLIVFSHLAPTSGDATCSSVKLVGPYNPDQRDLVGVVFQQIDMDEAGKPVFAFDIGNGTKFYLYCYSYRRLSGYGGSLWGVGPEYGSDRFALRQQEMARTFCTDHPVGETRTWLYAIRSTWMPYPDASVVCAQAPKPGTKTCDTVEIVGAALPQQSNRIGVPYTHTGDYWAGRPVFENAWGDYIYVCQTVYSQWCVGPKSSLTTSIVEMFVNSGVPHPAEATSTWYIRDEARYYQPYLNVTVKCVHDGLTTTSHTKAHTVSPSDDVTKNDFENTPGEEKESDEADKSSSNLGLVIGLAAASVVVIIALFLLIFFFVWKRVQQNNTQAGTPAVRYAPEAASGGVSSNTGRPSPAFTVATPGRETPTEYDDHGYMYPEVPEPKYEQLNYRNQMP